MPEHVTISMGFVVHPVGMEMNVLPCRGFPQRIRFLLQLIKAMPGYISTTEQNLCTLEGIAQQTVP